MSTEEHMAAAAARDVADDAEDLTPYVTLTREAFQRALAKAYLRGLAKGEDMEKRRSAERSKP